MSGNFSTRNDAYPKFSYPNGYCYLIFFYRKDQPQLRRDLGKFPTIDEIFAYAEEERIEILKNKPVKVQQAVGNYIHLTTSKVPLVTLEGLRLLYPGTHRVGGDPVYKVGEVLIGVYPHMGNVIQIAFWLIVIWAILYVSNLFLRQLNSDTLDLILGKSLIILVILIKICCLPLVFTFSMRLSGLSVKIFKHPNMLCTLDKTTQSEVYVIERYKGIRHNKKAQAWFPVIVGATISLLYLLVIFNLDRVPNVIIAIGAVFAAAYGFSIILRAMFITIILSVVLIFFLIYLSNNYKICSPLHKFMGFKAKFNNYDAITYFRVLYHWFVGAPIKTMKSIFTASVNASNFAKAYIARLRGYNIIYGEDDQTSSVEVDSENFPPDMMAPLRQSNQGLRNRDRVNSYNTIIEEESHDSSVDLRERVPTYVEYLTHEFDRAFEKPLENITIPRVNIRKERRYLRMGIYSSGLNQQVDAGAGLTVPAISQIPEVIASFNALNLTDDVELFSNKINHPAKFCFTAPRDPRKLRVSKVLSSACRKWLTEHAMGVELEFSEQIESPHPLNFALRAYHVEMINRDIPVGLRVLHVGSNPSAWPINGHVHSIPVLEEKDAARRVNAYTFINTSAKAGRAIEHTPLKLQHIKGRFDRAVLVHSCYNIPFDEAFISFKRLNVKTIYVTVFCNLDLLRKASGVLPAHNMKFYKSQRSDGTCNITFTHVREHASTYEHDWHNLHKWLICKQVGFSDGTAYFANTYINTPDCITMKYTLSPENVLPGGNYLFINNHSGIIRELNTFQTISHFGLNVFYFLDKLMIPTYLYGQMLSAASTARNPSPMMLAARVANLKGQWNEEQFHPYMESFASDNSQDHLMSTMIVYISYWSKYISDTGRTASTFHDNRSVGIKDMINSLHRFLDKLSTTLMYCEEMIEKITSDIDAEATITTDVLDIDDKVFLYSCESSPIYTLPSSDTEIFPELNASLETEQDNPSNTDLIGYTDSNSTMVNSQPTPNVATQPSTYAYMPAVQQQQFAGNQPMHQRESIVDRQLRLPTYDVGLSKLVKNRLNRTNWHRAHDYGSDTKLFKAYYENNKIPIDTTIADKQQLLGCITNNKLIEPITDLRHYRHEKHYLGKSYGSLSNTLLECVVNNAADVYQRIGDQEYLEKKEITMLDVNEWIVASFPNLCIVRNRLALINFPLHKEVKTENVVFVEWVGDKFYRIKPDEQDFCTLLGENGLFSLNCNFWTLQFFSILNPMPAEDGYCFYKSVHDLNLKAVIDAYDPKATLTCSPESIRKICYSKGVGIITKDTMYLPSAATADNVKQMVLVIGNHAFSIDENVDLTYIFGKMHRFIVCTTDYWDNALNGYPDYITNNNSRVTKMRMDTLQELFERNNIVLKSEGYSDRIKSVVDAVNYNVVLEQTLTARFLNILGITNDINYLKAVSSYYIYDTKSYRFVNGKPEMIFSAAWDDEQFVDVEYNQYTKVYTNPTGKPYLVMSPDVQFLREKKIVDFYLRYEPDILAYDFSNIRVTLYDGVPGCGKTYAIFHSHCKGMDLVATATLEAKNDYLSNIEQFNGYKDFYRTYDSILLNGCPEVDTLYADEGLMIHAGELLLASYVAKVSTLIIYGDKLQIPFISRALTYPTTHSVISLDETTEMNVTYRLPKTMMSILQVFYPMISTRSEIEGEVRVIKIKNVDFKPDFHQKYLTFTQFEKQTLQQNHSHLSVNTIHECQGKTYDSVAIVRLVPQYNNIYESESHIIVACSRHRDLLTYYTVDNNDVTAKLLSKQLTTTSRKLQTLEVLTEPITVYSIGPVTAITRNSNVSTTESEKVVFSEIYQSVLQHNLLGERYNPMGLEAHHTLDYPEPDLAGDIPHIDVAFVQQTIDCMYLPHNEAMLEREVNANPFPLEQEFSVAADKLLLFKESNNPLCKTVLKTPQFDRIKGTMQETIVAIRKRNLSPPIIHLPRDPRLIDEVVECFFDTYINKSALQVAKLYNSYNNIAYFEHFIKTRTNNQLGALDSRDFAMPNPRSFASHVKPDVKPMLRNEHTQALPAGQIVTAHDPIITAIASNFIRCFTTIIKQSLKSKWKINDGMTYEEINGHLNFITSKSTDKAIPQEIDFSKFDKSQEEILLAVQCQIMKRCGVSSVFVDYWFAWHTFNTLIFHNLGIKVRTKFQRRSGDAMTFIGNTIVTMASLAYVYDYNSALGGIFGGDDSLVFLSKDTKLLDQSKNLASLFNLVAKLEYYPEAIYFASKFVIRYQNQWYIVPDPIKAVVRLGRNDIYCEEHAREMYKSYRDNMRMYLNVGIRDAVAIAAKKRYRNTFRHVPADLFLITDFLAGIASSESEFLQIFEQDDSTLWKRKLPNAIKQLYDKEQMIDKGLTWMD